jgi:predicted NodU family carbamoyl transferase
MVVTFPVNESVKQKIPAVGHVDGTARIQRVLSANQPALQPSDWRVRQSEFGADAD